jgi:NAD(P)-dependent dehydrogenase (short-subunit alcohol dehydrogenase family)
MADCILVSGASSGIGAACARRFLDAGWEVAALARRQAPLDALAAEFPGRVLALACDLESEAAIAAAAAPLAAWRPQLAAIAHCAGDFLARPLPETSAAEFDRIWRVTVRAKHLLTCALLPQLEAAPGAHARAVVHLASLAAHRDFPNETAYMCAMHGVIGLARAQDAELRERGIRVAVVSPGLVHTPLTERSFGPAAMAGALPPEAMAESVYYLVATIRQGGYIPEIFHVPQNSI